MFMYVSGNVLDALRAFAPAVQVDLCSRAGLL